MLAFKLAFGRGAHRPEHPLELAQEEADLSSAEAQVLARLDELSQREEGSLRALDEQRQELTALVRSRAGAMAVEALQRFPPFLSPKSGPLAERERALEARRAAIEARRAALEAEERAAVRRDEALARSEETALGMKRSVEEIRARALEIVEQDKQQSERVRQVATAVAPPAPAPESVASATERRRFKRVAMEAEVSLSSDSNFYSGFSADLSDGGIFIATCNVLERGTEVDLTFSLPGGKPVSARGVVRWSREFNDATPDVFPGVGVEFTEMAPEERAAIHGFTEQREPLFWAS